MLESTVTSARTSTLQADEHRRRLYADLWFGVEPVYFKRVEGGETAPFCYDEWQLPTNDTDTTATEEPLPDTVPNIPGVLPVKKRATTIKEAQQQGASFENWPKQIMDGPLIKCKQDKTTEKSDLVGRVSGVRSCVVNTGDSHINDSHCWIRLKGSGNNSDGFVVRERLLDGKKEIRGCAFAHTALLECYNSELLARTLSDRCIPCNRPLGWYIYPPVAPDFTPVCIVAKTLGDRRLGSHLLAGLEMIFDELITEDCIVEEELVALFPAKRRIDKTSPHHIPSPAQIMVDYCLAGAYGLDQHGVDFPDLERDHTIFANCSHFNFHDRTPPCPDSKWASIWPQSSSRRPALPYLFSRLGADAGRFLRELHDAHYSWGTYADAMCLPGQLHCNAHSNNLVIVPPSSSKSSSLLCYLDLDMAFPTSDPVLLDMEHRNFAEVLVGAEMSSGVAATKRSTPLSGKAQLALYALQDLMLQSYLREYKQDIRYASLNFDAELHTAAYELIEMALVASCDIVA